MTGIDVDISRDGHVVLVFPTAGTFRVPLAKWGTFASQNVDVIPPEMAAGIAAQILDWRSTRVGPA